MSCNGKGFGKTNNTYSNIYLNSQFLGENQFVIDNSKCNSYDNKNNNCFPCYMTLGQYNNFVYNPNGYVSCFQKN